MLRPGPGVVVGPGATLSATAPAVEGTRHGPHAVGQTVPAGPTTEASRAASMWPMSSSPSNGEVLALEGISKSYGPVQALEGVDFRVRAGEVVALVGDNGAGKSTLVKVISGIHHADSGRVLFEGHPVAIAKPNDAVALGIATVHQDLALCDNLDVVANLFLGREETDDGAGLVLRSLDETDMERQTHELLGSLAVTITDVRAEVGTMSGGQRQQVAISRALLGEPKIMILDEPTAALGVRQTAQVLDLIKRLRDQGQGVVVVSHNLANVFAVADRIFVLRLGEPAGDFDSAEASEETVVAAITGADTVVPRNGDGHGGAR